MSVMALKFELRNNRMNKVYLVFLLGYGGLKDEYKVISPYRMEVDEVLVDFTNGGYRALSYSYSFKKHQECAA